VSAPLGRGSPLRGECQKSLLNHNKTGCIIGESCVQVRNKGREGGIISRIVLCVYPAKGNVVRYRIQWGSIGLVRTEKVKKMKTWVEKPSIISVTQGIRVSEVGDSSLTKGDGEGAPLKREGNVHKLKEGGIPSERVQRWGERMTCLGMGE